MADAPGSATLAFAPHWDVRVLDARRLLLLAETRSVLLTGKLYVALVPLLDGSRTRDEIVAALRAATAAPLDRIELAMATLLAKRYATPVAPGVPPARAAFWTELGVDPAGAEGSIRQTRVQVRPLGRLPGADERAAAQLGAALADAGFPRAADAASAELTLVLVDDYLDPRLDPLNRELRLAGRRWLPLKATGRVTWLGPIFCPDAGPCWACLAKRLGENRPEETQTTHEEPAPRFPRGDFPAGRGIALNLATLELARAAAGVAGAALTESTLLTLDLESLALARHRVFRRPACPACGSVVDVPAGHRPLRLEARPKLASADGGSRTRSPEEVLARLEPHVSPLTGLIGGLVNRSPAEGLPVYGARQIFPLAVGPRENRLIGRPDGASGKGMTEIQAKVSCLAEAVERYSTGWQGWEPRRRATLAELGPAAIHPDRLTNYSARQHATREAWNETSGDFNWVGVPFAPERAIDWTATWSLTHERIRWVPTQFCYFHYRGDPDHEFYRAESNGCASGSTLEEAILQGFLELVERDACALWWYNRVRRPAIDLAGFDDPYFRRTETHLRAIGRTLYALDLTTDLGIPVAVALSHDAAGGRVVCGLGAHLDAHVAVSRAVAELNQLTVLGTDEASGLPGADDPLLARWMREATIDNQPYLVPSSGSASGLRDRPSLETDDMLGDIEQCLAIVERCGLEMLVLDTTRAEVGFPTVRVTVPGLRHFWARFGPGRLYDVPVALGWLPRPHDETELNPIPFFL